MTANASPAKQWLLVALAAGACMPWFAALAAGGHLPQPWTVLAPGLCIFGAAFLLTWGAEAAEMDLPQSVSIGLLALIAVLPEYAVDMYFAWQAGKDPAYTAYATANTTGANRLLIGVGWPAVLLAYWWRYRKNEIHLSQDNAVELVALLAATVYAFIVPFKATLSWMDSVVFVSIFALYAYRSSQSHGEEPELEGPAALIGALDTVPRRIAVAGLFAFSAGAICVSAEPFAEGILDAGRHWQIEEFILVQWLAPLASEAPEFIVAILFALKGKGPVALRALVSSKVNQWTLLIGLLPAVYNLSAGSLAPMPMDARQVEEIFLTCAQSLFALVLIMNLEFSKIEALALLVLFFTQILFHNPVARYAFAGLYLVLAVGALVTQRGRVTRIRQLIVHACHR